MTRPNPKILIVLVLLLPAAAVLVTYLFRASTNPDLRAAEESLSRREFEQAGEWLDKYLLDHPYDVEVRLLAAQTARRQGQFDRARGHLKKYQELNGSRDRMELEFRLIGMQQGAVREVPRLMSEYGNRPEAPETALVMEAVVVGTLHVLAPRPSFELTPPVEATPLLIQLRRAVDLWLELRPGPRDQAEGLVWRGRIWTLMEDSTSAIADFRKALELNPDHFEARLNLAHRLAQTDPAEAVVHFTILRDRNPTDKQLRYLVATGYHGLGRLDEAARLLDEILAADPDNAVALLERGNVAMDCSQTADAEQFLLRALARSPNMPEINLALSQCMQLRGDAVKMKEYRDRFDQLEMAKKHQKASPMPKR